MGEVEAASFQSRRLITYLAEKGTKSLVATCDDRMVGYVLFGFSVDCMKAYIKSLAVLPSHRGSGVATGFLDRVISQAHQQDALDLSLNVRCSNTEALNFYTNKGFCPGSFKPGHYGEGQSAVEMLKALQPGKLLNIKPPNRYPVDQSLPSREAIYLKP